MRIKLALCFQVQQATKKHGEFVDVEGVHNFPEVKYAPAKILFTRRDRSSIIAINHEETGSQGSASIIIKLPFPPGPFVIALALPGDN